MQNTAVGSCACPNSDQGVRVIFGDTFWPFNLFANKRRMSNHQSSAAPNVTDVRKATKKEEVRDCHKSSASHVSRRQKGVESFLLGGLFGGFLKGHEGQNDPHGSRQGKALG